MSTESDLVALLNGNANVAGLVSGRVYTQLAPESATMPCLVYRITQGGGERTLSGHIIGQQNEAELWLLANSYGEIVQLKAAVLSASGGGYGSISRIYVEEGPDNYEFEDRLYSKIMTVEIVN